MRIFVAGASGTLGRPVVARLLARGHEVAGLSRTEAGRNAIERAGARGTIGNALDGEHLLPMVRDLKPDQVLHLLTALPSGGAFRPRDLTATNALRIQGTENLMHAAIGSGASRLIAESFVGVYGAASFGMPGSEDAALPPVGSGPLREAVLALRSLEDQLRAARSAGQIDTVALRIGLLYGPGVPTTAQMLDQARHGRLFVPRHARGVGSFVHIDDAAAAIVAAVEAPSPSLVYNVVDDEPTTFETFVKLTVDAAGSRPARQVPMWLVRLAAPVMAEFASVRLPLSNAKAKRELGWTLRYPTVGSGIRALSIAEAASSRVGYLSSNT